MRSRISANSSSQSLRSSGEFKTAADIEGSLIAGNPEEVIEQTLKFATVGVDHLVFDLRLRFETWFASIELLGNEVLPELRRRLG